MRNHKKETTVQPNTRQRLITLAVASACAAFMPAHAQVVDPIGGNAEPTKVVVTGIRAAMQSTLNLKKNSDGIVDGIVADDIGKFPDTNLAESLQRISGVSIDRNQGEGANMTVRGVGQDLNMVLLNGRQMPTSSLRDQNGRAFDFSNLASESVSQLQVYKTSRADTPPGGIGATVNVMTARPFDNPNGAASIGVKAVYDTSHDNLPGANQFGSDGLLGKSVTPEVSGLYSTLFGPDKQFGISVTGSFQKRRLGENRADITNGWLGPWTGAQTGNGTLSQAPSTVAVNRPGATELYNIPQNISYFTRGTERERINGQVALQWRPTKDLTTTLDYTYSQNKLHTKYNELSAWFGHGPSRSEWDNNVPSTPIYYEEIYGSGEDVSINGGDFATKTQNKSLGFNANWKVNNALRLNLDVHRSTAESGPDSPFGSNNDLGTASFSRRTTKVDFTNEMPVMSITGYDPVAAPRQVTGSWFQHAYQKMEIDQIQLGGKLSLLEASSLNFGVANTEVSNRTAFQQVQRDSWRGASSPADYAPGLFQADSLRQYFDKLGGHDNPALFDNYITFDFAAVRDAAIRATGDRAGYTPSLANPEYDRRTVEKSKAVYLQFNTEWDTAMPMHTGIGVRYEKTDVEATGLGRVPTGSRWVAQNEIPLDFGPVRDLTATGEYSNVLPSIDFDIEPRSDIKLRASYGVTIGRPRFDQIQGGQTISPTATLAYLAVNRGNPALKPVKSKNLDLSAEWYFGQRSVASLGFYWKDLTNYAGTSVNSEASPITTPVGGAYWNSAVAAGCLVTDTNCIRNWIFDNRRTSPGVTYTGVAATGERTGTIIGLPTDPVLNYQVTSVANEGNAKLRGIEANLQHMFGNTGFGVQANYTYVKSDLTYDNQSVGNQFALVGLSDSANLVGIYEDDMWSIRAAYNWRDDFLSNVSANGRANPSYVEAYGQLDVSVGYSWSKNLSFQLEVINATDETVRVHGRTKEQVLQAIQNGPRYMLAARYKF